PFLLLPAGLALDRLSKSTTLDGRIGYAMCVGLIVSSVLAVGCIVFVNYVPDSLSTSLFGLAVPLFEMGYLPPTVFNFIRPPHRRAGGLAVAPVGGRARVAAGGAGRKGGAGPRPRRGRRARPPVSAGGPHPPRLS